MKKILELTLMLAFSAALVFSIKLNVNAQNSPETIIGQVTLVGETTFKVREDFTKTEYELTASPDKLKNVGTGDRVEAKTDNGRVLSLTILGLPMKAQPGPSQRFTVTKQAGHVIGIKIGETSPGEPDESAVVTGSDIPETIIGIVTLLDERTLRVKEDITQTEYELTASPNKLKDVVSGYRVEVKTVNGSLVSLTILGMPAKAQSEPSQKFKVMIK
jgi:hypothetical protein